MLRKSIILCSFLSYQMIGVAFADSDLLEAESLANDFSLAISSATKVIAELQPAINTGAIYAARLKPEIILKDFHDKFKMKSGEPFYLGGADLISEYRVQLEIAITEVMQENEEHILSVKKGSFVPAFFRASVLEKFNKSMGGRISGQVTTSDHNLINKNSSVATLLGSSPVFNEASKLIQAESTLQKSMVVDGHYMSYRPMRLEASCVSCHGYSGLKQRAGEYGGALIIDINMNK